MAPRIEKAVVSGVFSLDGQDFDVDNNVWLVGNDDEVLVIDAPTSAPSSPGTPCPGATGRSFSDKPRSGRGC